MENRGGKSQRREEKKREDQRGERESEKKDDAGSRKSRKVAIHRVFPMICGSGGSKSNLAKAAGVEPSGQMRDEKVYAVVARSTFPSQKVKSTSRSDHFWKLTCPKSAHSCGAKHISKSKCTVQSTPTSDHFWKLTCPKSINCCGAKHISKSKCTVQSTPTSDHFLKLRCSKSAHSCGAKHIFKSKCTVVSTPTSDHFWKLRCSRVHTVVARSTFPSQKCKKLRGSDHFLTFRFPFA